MENDEAQFLEENATLIQTWSEYVKVSLANGKSGTEIRERLRENKLTERQIDLLFNPKSRNYVKREDADKKARYRFIGAIKIISGLVLLIAGGAAAGGLLILGGFVWLMMAGGREA